MLRHAWRGRKRPKLTDAVGAGSVHLESWATVDAVATGVGADCVRAVLVRPARRGAFATLVHIYKAERGSAWTETHICFQLLLGPAKVCAAPQDVREARGIKAQNCALIENFGILPPSLKFKCHLLRTIRHQTQSNHNRQFPHLCSCRPCLVACHAGTRPSCTGRWLCRVCRSPGSASRRTGTSQACCDTRTSGRSCECRSDIRRRLQNSKLDELSRKAIAEGRQRIRETVPNQRCAWHSTKRNQVLYRPLT